MPVDLQPKPDGRWHVILGSVEKWIVVAVATGAVTAAGWNMRATSMLLTNTAVMNSQLSTISAQMGDVQTVRSDVTELKVRVGNLEDRTRELQRLRDAQ